MPVYSLENELEKFNYRLNDILATLPGNGNNRNNHRYLPLSDALRGVNGDQHFLLLPCQRFLVLEDNGEVQTSAADDKHENCGPSWLPEYRHLC